MGSCASSDGGLTADEVEAMRLADSLLAAQRKEDAHKVKLLILGSGESGKSTLFKQMKLLYGAKFTNEESMMVRCVIYENVLDTLKALAENVEGFSAGVVACKDELELVFDADSEAPLHGELGDAVKCLWCDPAIMAMWARRSELQVIESVHYFFNKLEEICEPSYEPSVQDIMFARVRTHGIVTEKYLIEGKPYEMYDVGGQRNERRKWVHCFDGVTAVLFIAALSEYDQRMFEDETTNRMEDALSLFEEICNNRVFDKSAIILFLNKRDLYTEKIKKVAIGDQPSFKDYAGAPYSFDEGIAYFTNKFVSLDNGNDERKIYSHATCATDTSNVKLVFNSCRDTILQAQMAASGFT